jgi:phage gp16-like protein
MKMIEPVQLKLIHIAKKQCGLDDTMYRDIITAQTKGKKQSSRDLSYFEADAVINYFVKKLGFKIQSNYIRTAGAARRQRWAHANMRRAAGGQQRPANVYVMASADQIKMINALAGQVAWKVKGGFHLWMIKYYKIDMVKTDKEASDVIEGLKKLLDHQVGNGRDRSLQTSEE